MFRKFTNYQYLKYFLTQMSFNDKLLKARKKKGISQAELAKLLGTKAPVVGRYERGEVNPSIEVAKNLSNILGVSLDYLVGNTDLELDSTVLKRVEDILSFLKKNNKRFTWFLML